MLARSTIEPFRARVFTSWASMARAEAAGQLGLTQRRTRTEGLAPDPVHPGPLLRDPAHQAVASSRSRAPTSFRNVSGSPP